MKRTTKLALTVGVTLCLAGGILLGIGAAAGGLSYVRTADLNDLSGKRSGEAQTFSMEKTKLESFTQLQVDLNDTDLVLAPSDDDSVYLAAELQSRDSSNPLSYEMQDGTLTLGEQNGSKTGYSVHIDIGFLSAIFGQETEQVQNVVTLYLPADTLLESSTISLQDGDMTAEGWNSKTVDCTLQYGDLNLKTAALRGGTVTLADGDLTADEVTADGVQWELKYGDAALQNTALRGGTVTLTDGDLTADALDSSGVQWVLQYGGADLKNARMADDQIKLADGDMTAQELTLAGQRLSVTNTYGDVSLSLSEASAASDLALSLVAENGDVSMGDRIQTPENQTISSESAAVQSGGTDRAAGRLDVQCEDGDITVN